MRLLYTFLYSNPTALGWDDSITVNGSGETKDLTYTVKVGERKFRTFGGQLHNAAGCLMGRNTRVWNVREVLNGRGLSQATYVIKDTWTDEDRRREGEVYDLLDELPLDAEEKSYLQKVLLTKVCHADVVVDNTLDITLDLSDIKDPHDRFDLIWGGPIEDPSSFDYQREAMLPPLVSRGRMIHNRIVFKEFGTPLHATDSLVQVFKSLGEVAIGMSFTIVPNAFLRPEQDFTFCIGTAGSIAISAPAISSYVAMVLPN